MKPTNSNIKLGQWTLVVEYNDYHNHIIVNKDDINDIKETRDKWYNVKTVDRIRYFDKENNVYMIKTFK